MANGAAGTRERLLEAACAAFADKGFRDATVADICGRADANIAAVNYHFGSKEQLYVEAWRHAHRAVLSAFPPDGGVPPDAPPEQRLRGRIRSLVLSTLGPRDEAFQIMALEMAHPTGLLGQVFRESIRPLRALTETIVAELLGPEADEASVRLCTTCVTAPCLHLMRMRRMQSRLKQRAWQPPTDPEVLVEQFTTFALGGIAGIRVQLQQPRGVQEVGK